MSGTNPPHRSRAAAALLLGSCVLAASGTAVPSLSGATTAPVRAVVSYTGDLPVVGGVVLVRPLDALDMAVVQGSPAALARLARTAGVRGLAPDAPVVLTAGRPASAAAVPAAQGLGGRAGKAGSGHGVRIAVVDSGVSDTPALDRRSGRLVDAFDSSTSAAPGPLVDGFGHGTFMATIAAGGPVDGSRGEAVGVAPGATVLVVRVAQPDGTTSLSRVVAGLNWVAENADQVDVANLSLSYDRPGPAYGPDPLTDAVEAVRDAGVTVVVSSGNAPNRVGDPGFAPRALTVGAVDLTGRTEQVADFSGSDVVAGLRKPDVVANGVSVLGVLPADSVVARANPGARVSGQLWRGSGTSQAAAVTSGVVALVLDQRPGSTPAEVTATLRGAARPLIGERDGAGSLRVSYAPTRGAELSASGPGGLGGGGVGFDANSWAANSWSANSWSANSWSANSWSANSWSSVGWTTP